MELVRLPPTDTFLLPGSLVPIVVVAIELVAVDGWLNNSCCELYLTVSPVFGEKSVDIQNLKS